MIEPSAYFELLILKDLNNYNETDVLHYAQEKGIIPDIEAMLKEIDAMERKEILEQHPYRITVTSKSNGSQIFSTYLTDIHGKRLYRRRNTRAELENVIVQHYRTMQEEIYFDKVFHEWIDRKMEFGEIQKASYDRYLNDYHRFFETTPNIICKKKFRLITEDDLECFIKTTIRNLALSRKAYAGLRTLIRGTFRYGKKKGYTTISITHFFGDLDLPRNIFQRKVIDREQEVFSEDEVPLVTDYLREHSDIINLGILLAFETGMRVGELSSLKKEDIANGYIKVRRTEDKYRNENGKWVLTVKEHTKTDAGNRDLIIPRTAQETLQRIIALNPDGEFLFENSGKRIRGNTFNKRLSAICNKLEIPHRTMHKIRKTYGTTLLDNQVDEGFVIQQMGHSDISTTKKLYYFSNKNQKTKAMQIENAISF